MEINLLDLKENRPHFPVLIREILDYAISSDDKTSKVFVDCTFGAGGYSELILQNSSYKIIGIDRDKIAETHASRIQNIYGDRLSFHLEKFSNLDKVLESLGIEQVDGIIMDLGFSSMQIKNAQRGFSIKESGELSMEMGLNSFSAYDFINNAKQEVIADVIYHYGEERKAKQIARNIVEKRAIKQISTSGELVTIIKQVVGSGGYHSRIDSATRTFQAIRIYTNDELKELQQALNKSVKYLRSGGKLLVVSFHSLEDRIVKDFLNQHGKYHKYKDGENNKNISPSAINSSNINNPHDIFNILTKKPLLPQEDEMRINPPSSSAKLRVAEKI